MNNIQNRNLERRGIGFAVLILTVGIIWLLFAINLIPASGVNIALSLWPLALIAIGADLLMQKQSPQIGMYIVLAIAAFVVLAALLAPRLGIGVLETKTGTYTEQIANAESATINLHPGVGHIDVHALQVEDVLFNAEAIYLGDVNYTVHGTTQRQIDFGQNEVSTTGWLITDKDLYWNVGLTPNIPLNLSINTGVGEANLDLSDLQLTTLNLTAGVGRVSLMLPDQNASYQVTATGGVGDFDVEFPENANVSMSITGGVGAMSLDVPDNTAVRIRVTSGLGGVHVPSWLGSVDLGTDERIWQSNDFETAPRRISVHIRSGLGVLTVR